MALPQFTVIEEIEKLLQQLSVSKNRVAELEKELEEQKKYFSAQEEAELSKRVSEGKQVLLLQKVEADIKELIAKELEVRFKVEVEIKDSINKYFEGDDYRFYVGDLITQIKKETSDYKVKAGLNTKRYLPPQEKYEEAQDDGSLIIDLNYKLYVLDPEVVKKELFTKILNSSL